MFAHGCEIYRGELAIAENDAAVDDDCLHIAADGAFGQGDHGIDDGELIGIVGAYQHDVGELAGFEGADGAGETRGCRASAQCLTQHLFVGDRHIEVVRSARDCLLAKHCAVQHLEHIQAGTGGGSVGAESRGGCRGASFPKRGEHLCGNCSAHNGRPRHHVARRGPPRGLSRTEWAAWT